MRVSVHFVPLLLLALFVVSCGSDDPAAPGGDSPQDTVLPANPEGILLPGESTDPVGTRIVAMEPSAVPAEDIDDGLLTTRLDAWINPAATVAGLNAALENTGTRIVSMRKGSPLLTLRMDAAATRQAARAKADELQALPEFLHVQVAEAPRSGPVPVLAEKTAEKILPDPGMLPHLRSLRMAAAWHALPRAQALNHKVPALVMDGFSEFTAHPEIPAMNFPGTAHGNANPNGNHGWHVAGIMGAQFAGDTPIGVHPAASDLMEIIALPIGGLTWGEMLGDLVTHFPATGKFVINTSLGWPVDEAFAQANGGNWPTQKLVDGAALALAWRIATSDHWDRFLHATAAGNEREYAGNMKDARIESPWTIAHFYDDPRQLFAPGALNATQQTALDALVNLVQTTYPAAAVAQPNVIAVGSSDGDGNQSSFSNDFAEIRVEGEDVFSTCRVTNDDCDGSSQLMSGTSMATPQVAALAAWLWNLDSELTPLDVYDRLLRSYTTSDQAGRTNGYLLTLSADPSLTSSPIRQMMLDVAGSAAQPGTNGIFDQADIELYLAFFESYELERQELGDVFEDYSRYDLNGDNLTGGEFKAPIDLNVNGLPELSTANLTVGTNALELDESSVSDLDCLCYYAYSPLYDGNESARDQLLLQQCGGELGAIAVEIFGMPDRFPVNEAVEITVRAGVNTDNGIDYMAGIEIDMDVDNGVAEPSDGFTDESGYFTTQVTMDSDENEIIIEAEAELGSEQEGMASVSAIRPDQIEILSRRAAVLAEVFAAYCPDFGVLCPRFVENWDLIEDDAFVSFDETMTKASSATMAGMPLSGECTATGMASLDVSGTDFAGASLVASVDGTITLSNPNTGILSYQAQADGYVEMCVEFVVWGEAATFNISGSVSGEYYDVDLDGEIDAFECDSSDAPCSSLSGSGTLPPGEYDFDVYIDAGGYIRGRQDCTDCPNPSGTQSGSGTVDVTISVQH